MAFDCVIVDFQKDQKNKEFLFNKFPYALSTPFVGSYFDILKSFVDGVKTDFFWLTSDLVNLQHFDFNFIPDQHQQKQIHVWNTQSQREGDIMLLPTNEFKSQMNHIKFLRDYKDINYHDTNFEYNEWPSFKFTFDNLTEQIKNQKTRYANYYFKKQHSIIPSFWEDQKLYVLDKNRLNLLVPRFDMKEELYEYSPTLLMDNPSEKLNFDICYIHNGEPQAQENLMFLKQHLKKKPNKLHIIEGVKGRKEAYQTAARASETEYFYAVFAKLKVNKDFAFDFVPDTLKSPRHYIFDCFNPVINYTYGHQAIILYNKKLTLENDGKGLDFTLSQKHDHISLLSAETTFYTDPQVCYRTAFREIVKLLYNKKLKPTVENNFILKKWSDLDIVPGASYVNAAREDALHFVRSHDYNFDVIFKSYEWDYVDVFYKKRYN